MPRIRTIKPSFFASLSLAKCTRDARLLFVGLWVNADDDGRMEYEPRLIRSQVFPLDDEVLAADIDRWVGELVAAKEAVCLYEVDGTTYLHMPKWHHQVINRRTPSELPPCAKHPDSGPKRRRQAPPPGATGQVAGEEPARRCAAHEGVKSAPRCGACKEARETWEKWKRDQPTFSGKTTMCGEHPEHPALNCPGCAQETTEGPPADWRERAGTVLRSVT